MSDSMVANNEGSARTALFEATTVIALFVVALLYARPELEGWGVQDAFRSLGLIDGYKAFVANAPTRLLEPLPIELAWMLGHGGGWGIGAVYGLIVAGKYAAARWTVTSVILGPARWMLATLAVVMLPWEGEWRAHNMAQQVAAILVILALGFALRVALNRDARLPIGLFFSVVLALLSYEGVALCVLAIPLVVLMAVGSSDTARVWGATLTSLVAYGAYFAVVNVMSTSTYHHLVLADEQPIRHPLRLLMSLYETAYLSSPFTLAALVLLLGVAVSIADPRLQVSRVRVVKTTIGLVVIPLLALPYAVNFYFLADIERVGLPTGIGVVFLSVIVTSGRGSPKPILASSSIAVIPVVAMIAFAAADAYACYRPYAVERSVLTLTADAVQNDHAAHEFLLLDYTGQLGDTYTFLNPDVFRQAAKVFGINVPIDICRPVEIDLQTPDRFRSDGHSYVPRCDAVAQPLHDRRLLELRSNPLNRLGSPILIAGGVVSAVHPSPFSATVTVGSQAGREGDLVWLNLPDGALSVENRTDKAATVRLTGHYMPPPCAEPVKVTMTASDASATNDLAVNAAFDLPVDVPAGGAGEVVIHVDAAACRIPADTRRFYVGLVKLEAH